MDTFGIDLSPRLAQPGLALGGTTELSVKETWSDVATVDMAAELAETSEWYRTHDRTIQTVD